MTLGIRLQVIAAILVAWGVPSQAEAAGICAASDEERDSLVGEERQAAREVFEREVLAAGGALGPPCTQTWRLAHARLASGVHVLVVTPAGAFTAWSPTLEALPGAYQLVAWKALAASGQASLLTAPAASPSASETASGRPEVVKVTQPSPGPAASPLRGAFYLRIGFGVSPATRDDLRTLAGPTIGLGYRRWIDRWLFDLSVMNLHGWRKSSEFDAGYDVTFASFGRLAAHRLMPRRWGAYYFGGGLSFGQPKARFREGSSDGTDEVLGLQLEGAAGIEVLRDQAVRIFIEAWVTLPLALTETRVYDTASTREERYWVPFVGASTGIGF